MLRTTPAGLKLIETFEGVRTKAYLCPAGTPTIGIGHTSDAGGMFTLSNGSRVSKVVVGQEITKAEAQRLFEQDIDEFEEGVLRELKHTPSRREFDALVSLTFNIGIGNFRKSTVLRKFNAGDAAGAADAFLAWNKATVNGQKVVVKGLVRRREAERWYFLGDIEMAEKIAETKLGAMPREVDPPVLRETISKSATGNTAAATGAVGLYATYEGVKQAIAAGHDLKDTVSSAGDLLLGGASPWMVLVGAGAAAAIGSGIIWYRRWQRSKDDEVIEADPGILIADAPPPPPLRNR